MDAALDIAAEPASQLLSPLSLHAAINITPAPTAISATLASWASPAGMLNSRQFAGAYWLFAERH